jgi:hypothetical protein
MEVFMSNSMVHELLPTEHQALGISAMVRELGGRILNNSWEDGWCDFVIGLDAMLKELHLPTKTAHVVLGEFTFRLYRNTEDDGWYLNLPNLLVFEHDYKDHWMRDSMELMIEQGQVQFLVCDKFLTLRSFVSVGLMPMIDGLRASMARLINSWELLVERLHLSTYPNQNQSPRLIREVNKAILLFSLRKNKLTHAPLLMLRCLGFSWMLFSLLESVNAYGDQLRLTIAKYFEHSKFWLSKLTLIMVFVLFINSTSTRDMLGTAEGAQLRQENADLERWKDTAQSQIAKMTESKASLSKTVESLKRSIATKQNELRDLEQDQGRLLLTRDVLRKYFNRVYIPNLTRRTHLNYFAERGLIAVPFSDGVIVYLGKGADEETLEKIESWYPKAQFCPADLGCDTPRVVRSSYK